MDDIRSAVLELGDLGSRPVAVAIVKGAGAGAIPALREGVAHPYWRVRQMSCRLLDDLPLDQETIDQLLHVARTDPHKRVRNQAWHAATCEPCKPPESPTVSCRVDKLVLIAEQLADRSLRIRRSGATGLLFAALDPDIDTLRLRSMVDRVLASELDTTITTRARRAAAVLDNRAG
jgi:hypothetical protein